MAILALMVSAASFGFNFWFNNVKARIDRQPVLSFVDTGKVWELRNIGNGAALNIIIQKNTFLERGPARGMSGTRSHLSRHGRTPLRNTSRKRPKCHGAFEGKKEAS